MSDNLKYKFNGKMLSKLDALKEVHEQADHYSDETKKAFLEQVGNFFTNEAKMETQDNWFTKIIAPLAGLLLITTAIIIAINYPHPTKFQASIFWLTMSLGVAIGFAFVAGTIEFTNKLGVKAIGGAAVWAITFFYLPTIFYKTQEGHINKMSMYVVGVDSTSLQRIDVDFDLNTTDKISDVAKQSLISYTGIRPQFEYTCYRKSDGKIYSSERCNAVDEYELLMISDNAVKKWGGKREAYIHFKPIADSIAQK